MFGNLKWGDSWALRHLMGRNSFQSIFTAHSGYLSDRNSVSLALEYKLTWGNIHQQSSQVFITQTTCLNGFNKTSSQAVTLITRYCVSSNQAHRSILDTLQNSSYCVLSICVFLDILKIRLGRMLFRRYFNRCLLMMDHQRRCKLR